MTRETVKTSFILAMAWCLSATALAQEEKPAATLDDVAWIAGHWQGEAMGGRFEETWNPPAGGSMMGMFKTMKDGSVGFYELLTIVPRNGSLVLRLKHFDNKLVGWEEKDQAVEFPLVSLSEDKVEFDGLVFRRISDSEMEIRITVDHDGEKNEVLFPCRRVTEGDSDTESAIRRVLEMDSVLSSVRNEATNQIAAANAVRHYIHGLQEVNVEGCPEDVKKAFEAHEKAWRDAIPFLEKHSGRRGEMHDVFDEIRALGDEQAAEMDRHFQNIMSTWEEVEAACQRHGVQ